MTDAINWFEIPVKDLERATRFYEVMLGKKLKREVFGGTPMATFPTGAREDVGGSLVADPKCSPSASGSLVYLDAPDLDDALVRAKKAGGTIELPKTDIGEPGHIAIVIDTEGNRIGLHAHRN
jgi:predicted enzyme related to lactoylglutathione lyase